MRCSAKALLPHRDGRVDRHAGSLAAGLAVTPASPLERYPGTSTTGIETMIVGEVPSALGSTTSIVPGWRTSVKNDSVAEKRPWHLAPQIARADVAASSWPCASRTAMPTMPEATLAAPETVTGETISSPEAGVWITIAGLAALGLAEGDAFTVAGVDGDPDGVSATVASFTPEVHAPPRTAARHRTRVRRATPR